MAKTNAIYKHPSTGETWSGRGLKPKWLAEELKAGRTLEEFQTEAKPTPTPMTLAGELQTLPIYLIDESPFNPRKSFDQDKLEDLAKSIREVGIIQPIRVRPRTVQVTTDQSDGAVDGYEIVFGHRRFRAAKLASLHVIPCMVSTLTDAESAQLQAIENLQREDLDPIEEAEGYVEYIKTHGVTKDDLAIHISKSRTYVYNRLKLATLCESGRKHVREGALGAELATLVARLPTVEMQEAALQKLRAGIDDGSGPVQFDSYADGRELLDNQFNRHLEDALFDRQIMWLVPDRPDCTSCPERAGNIEELNATGRRADVCTNPGCFDLKSAAHFERLIEEAGKLAGTVISGKEAANYFDKWQDHTLITWDYRHGGYCNTWDLDTVRADLGVTPREAMGKRLKIADTICIVNPTTGKYFFAVHRDTLVKLKLVEPVAEKEAEEPKAKQAPVSAADKAAASRKRYIGFALRHQVILQIRARATAVPRSVGDLAAVTFAMFELAQDSADDDVLGFADWLKHHNTDLAARYQLYAYGAEALQRTVAAWEWIHSLSADTLGMLLLEMALLTSMEGRYDTDGFGVAVPDPLMVVAKNYEVNPTELIPLAEAQVEADEAAEAEEEANRAKATKASKAVKASNQTEIDQDEENQQDEEVDA